MLPDDVFRERLEQTLIGLEKWAQETRNCAEIEIIASDRYWRMDVRPSFPGACPFELLINSSQTFDLSLDGEVYENRPIENFDLFLKIANSIAAGRVEQIETRNALTGIPIAIAMRVELTDGFDWIGFRTVLKRARHLLEQDEVRRAFRYLPYGR
jgi:hypothetical protein